MFNTKMYKLIFPLLLVLFCITAISHYANATEVDEISRSVKEKQLKWQPKASRLSQLPSEERRKRLGAIIPAPAGQEKVLTSQPMALPVRLDWRDYSGGNYVTPIKEQGSCGICWAFATTAALESNVLISKNTPSVNFDLSEQVLASCSNVGSCLGGYIDGASDFIRDVGLPEESCYPYAGADNICSNACTNWPYNTYKISNWLNVSPTVDAIKYALYNYGPLVTIQTVHTDFFYYQGGIYSYAWGGFEGYHTATIIGYDDAEQYFIVKSSWGADWGENGFFRIAYSELNNETKFGSWTIAYGNPIATDFPSIDGITRDLNNPNSNNQDPGSDTQTPPKGTKDKRPADDSTNKAPTDANGQKSAVGPGWFKGRSASVSHDKAETYYASKRNSAASMKSNTAFFASAATDVAPQITELARALRYDPKLIYDYVHNHIDYVPYFGSLKGATLTYLDGSGNDFDQASLLIALLRVSGYTAQYVYGKMTIPGAQIANWLGVDQLQYGIGSLLANNGIPVDYIQLDGTSVVTRVWVQATIGGTSYLFDPAFKSYTYNTKIDLGQAMGYNRSDLLAAATSNATVGSNYVQNLNETSLKNKLAAYSSNLVTAIRDQYPNSDVSKIIGGRSIAQTDLTQYTTSLPFTPAVTAIWDTIPNSYIATLRVEHSGAYSTLNIPDLSGKRLTWTYEGSDHHPVLTLDGTPLAAWYGHATTLGSQSPLTITIDHPYSGNAGSYMDQTSTYTQVISGSTYAIVYNFGGASDALLQKRQQQLDNYIAQGLANTSEFVLGETLNIMGLTYLKEVQLANRLLSGLADTVYVQHHMVGLMAQEAGYYVDVKSAYCSISSKHNLMADEDTHFKESGLIASAFEHGILEQLMGSGKPGVSTMKLFQIANAAGRKVFSVNSANFATVSPQLTLYSAATLAYFQSLVNSGMTLILPDTGELCFQKLTLPSQLCPSGQWKGDGYIAEYFTTDHSSMAMVIGGGYYGGYASTPAQVDTPTINEVIETGNYGNSSPSTVNAIASPIATPTSSEPVDMASGAYLYDNTDLVLGGSAPLGLQFSRSYNSSMNLTKRTMGFGWTHNYDIYYNTHSHGDPGLGRRQPVDAAATISALYAALDMLKAQDNITVWMTASLTSKWAVDQVIDNAVTVHMGSKVMEFIKLADGTYASPPGITTQIFAPSFPYIYLWERSGTYIYFGSNKYISAIRDIDGNYMTFGYTGTNLTSVRDAFNRGFTLNYTDGRIGSVVDSSARTVSYGYNAAGEMTTYTDPELKSWVYGYESTGRMTRLTDPLNVITATNSYDSLGRVKTQTVPRQGGINVIYNFYFSGFKNAEEDPYHHFITYNFDDKGREVARENALGQKSFKKYDGQNHTVTVTDPRLNSTIYQYDGKNNLTKVINATTNSITYAYDPLTYDLTDITDDQLHNTHFGYDTRHHLTLTRDNLGNTASATYGFMYLKDSATDGLGTVSNFTYDSYGNPLTAKTAAHPELTYAYDPIGRMTGFTDQVSAQTTFEYDKRSLLRKKIDSTRTNFSSYTYYDDGKLWTKTDRIMSTLTYTYTPSGKLDTILYPDASTVSFKYDLHDKLIEMWDSIGVTQYAPDALGRPSTVTDPRGFAVSYTYDETGNLKELTYPGNNKVIYTYDELNRLKTVTIDWLSDKPVATYNYNAQEAGLLDNLVHFNGLVTGYAYDTAHRLTGITSTVASYQFPDIDGNGNRRQVVQSEPLAPSITTASESYAYNTTGTRLLSAGSNGFGYDNEGQLSNGYGSGYTFDYEHRLTGIGSTSFYYDGSGNRLQATRSGVTTRYIYDTSGNLLAEADGNNVITKYYIYGAGLLAMVTPAGDVYSYHYNALGSTVAMTDQSHTMTNTYAYDPFGTVSNQVEAVPQPFKYVGQSGVMTEPSGFYYMRARYYDPSVGRFISEDPMGLGGGDVNLMAYVGNNPINGIDPSGLWTASLGVYLAGYVGAFGAGGGGAINIGYSSNAGLSISLTGTYGGGAATGFGGGLAVAGSVTNASSVNKLLGTSVEASRGLGPVTLTGVAGAGYQGVGAALGLAGTNYFGLAPQGSVSVTNTSAIVQYSNGNTSIGNSGQGSIWSSGGGK